MDPWTVHLLDWPTDTVMSVPGSGLGLIAYLQSVKMIPILFNMSLNRENISAV